MRCPVNMAKPFANRDDVWKEMCNLKLFTTSQLLRKIKMDKTTIDQYVRSLVKAGYMVREPVSAELSAGKGVCAIRYQYRIVRESLEAPRVRKDGTTVTQGQGRQNIWRSMRILKRFDLATIWAVSGTEEHPVAREEVKTYVRYLTKAGYLKKMGEGEKAVYMIIRYTGPKAPMIQRVKQIWDPNLKEVVWPIKKQ
jgi:hypothetical protein